MNIDEALKKVCISTTEARNLLRAATGYELTYILSHGDAEVKKDDYDEFIRTVKRRTFGYPLGYLVGHREFYGFEFIVSRETLLPRPETEMLVDFSLEVLSERISPKLLDLGCGSGVVGISVSLNHPTVEVLATDLSGNALAIAYKNLKRLHVDQNRFQLLESDWFNEILKTKKYDLIVSNPPYIQNNDVHLTKGDLRFEPSIALKGGFDGLDHIRNILDKSGNYLNKGGWLVLEHGFDQSKICRNLFKNYGFSNVQQREDLSGHIRLSAGQLEKVYD